MMTEQLRRVYEHAKACFYLLKQVYNSGTLPDADRAALEAEMEAGRKAISGEPRARLKAARTKVYGPGDAVCCGVAASVANGTLFNLSEVVVRRTRAGEALPGTWDEILGFFCQVTTERDNAIAENSADTPDSKADTQNNSLPDSVDVRDLCRLLQKGLPAGKTQTEIAREFAENNAKKADSLLRQARRYRHLWA